MCSENIVLMLFAESWDYSQYWAVTCVTIMIWVKQSNLPNVKLNNVNWHSDQSDTPVASRVFKKVVSGSFVMAKVVSLAIRQIHKIERRRVVWASGSEGRRPEKFPIVPMWNYVEYGFLSDRFPVCRLMAWNKVVSCMSPVLFCIILTVCYSV